MIIKRTGNNVNSNIRNIMKLVLVVKNKKENKPTKMYISSILSLSIKGTLIRILHKTIKNNKTSKYPHMEALMFLAA
jgi:hypothetical protein